MKSSTLDRISAHRFSLSAVATVVSTLCAPVHAVPAAQALPAGAQVTSGSASFSTSGAALQIQQTSAHLVTNWQRFDIGSAAKVEFIQPSATSIALNRVTGANASEIFGVLKSNGRIFLVNPNGILFGASARVDTGAMVASTMNIRDQDFLDGKYQFDLANPAGQVKNFGEIIARQGGFVALLGAEVDNAGRVVATGGQAALAAGQTVRLQIGETGLLGMDVVAGQTSSRVNNSGAVVAQGGNVLMSAQSAAGLLSGAVNLTGLVQASRIDGQGGKVRLDGGEVTVAATGRIEASGQGTDVMLWSERATRMDGTITAQGGKAETSSKGTLGVTGNVTAQEWLLDPTSLSVVNTVTDATSQVAAASIQNSLNTGTNVSLGASGDATAAGTITVNADISKTAGAAATLLFRTDAYDADAGVGVTLVNRQDVNVVINNPISSIAGALNVQFGSAATDSGGLVTLNAPLATNGGTVTFYKVASLAHATPISTKITETSSAQSGSIVFEKNALLSAPGYAVSLDTQGPQSGGSYTGQGGNIQFKGDILSAKPTNLPQYAQALTLDTTGFNGTTAQNGPGNTILGTNSTNVVGGSNRTFGTVTAIKSLTLLGDMAVDLNAGAINIVSSNGDVITGNSRLGTPTVTLNATDTAINVYGDPLGNLAGNVAGYTDYAQSTFNIAGGLTTAQSLTVNSDRAIKLVDRSITANSTVGAAGLQVTLNPNSGSGVGGVVMNNATVTTGGRAFTVNNAEGNGSDVQLLTDGFYAYNSQVRTAGGTLSVTAEAPTDTAAGAGIRLVGANTVLSSAAGNMTLRGSVNQFAASGNKDGVIIGEGGNARVTLQTTSGHISVTGNAAGAGFGETVTGGSRYDGVVVSSKALIETTSGNITLEGAGGGGDKVFISENHGVRFADADTSVVSTSGNIAIVGTSGGKTKGTSGANSFGLYAEGANIYVGSKAADYATTGASIGLLSGNPSSSGHVTLAADSMQFVNTSASHLKAASTGELRIHTLGAATAIEVGATTGELATALNATTQYLGSTWFNGSTNALFQPGFRDVVIGNAKQSVDHVNGEVATVGSTGTLTVSAATTFRDNLVLDMNGTGGNVNIGAGLTVARAGSDDRTLTINTQAGAQATGLLRVDGVQLLGGGDQLFTAGNLVNTLAANVNGDLLLVNNQNLQVGTVSVFGGDAALPSAHASKNKWLDRAGNTQAGAPTEGITATIANDRNVTLSVTNGNLDQTAAGAIQAKGLIARATGLVDLFKADTAGADTNQNDVTNLAGSAAAGNFAWVDANGFKLATVVNTVASTTDSQTGVVAVGTGNTVDLRALTGDITQDQFVRADNLRARAVTGSVVLNGRKADLATPMEDDNRVIAVSGTAGQGFAYTDADSLQVGTTGAALSGAQTAGITAGVTIDLRSQTGGLSQTAAGALNAVNLQAAAATGVVLDTASNTVANVAGSTTTSDFVYKDADSVEVGTVATVAGITAAAGRVSLASTAGALTQTAAGVIATPSLRAVAATGVALATANNNVQTLAGAATANGFAFKNAAGFTVGAVVVDGVRLSSEGIAAANLVDLQANTSNIAQSSAGGITGSELRAVAPGGVFLATADDNNVATVAGAASAGHFAFKDAVGNLDVGTAGSSTGVVANATNGTVDLQVVAGSLTQTQTATGYALRARASNTVTLTLANDVTKLAGSATTGNFSYRDANSVAVSTVAAAQDSTMQTAGISTDVASATVDLQAATALGQDAGGALAARNARLVAGSVELKERSNAVSILAGQATGGFAFYGTPDLTVGTATGVTTVQGITAAGKVDVQSRGNLTLAKAVSGVAEGFELSDEAVVLRAEKRFFNETGLNQSAIVATGGRWLVYDNNPLLLTKDMRGLENDRNFLLINTRYQDYLPQDVYAKGNGYITTAQALDPADASRLTSGHQRLALGNQSRQFSLGDLTQMSALNQQFSATGPGAKALSASVMSAGAAVPLRVGVAIGRAFKLDLSEVLGQGRVSGIAAADGSATAWVATVGKGQLIGTAPKATELVVSIVDPGQAQPRKVRVQLQAL
jgi:filamentous hemagglutinin family protein